MDVVRWPGLVLEPGHIRSLGDSATVPRKGSVAGEIAKRVELVVVEAHDFASFWFFLLFFYFPLLTIS